LKIKNHETTNQIKGVEHPNPPPDQDQGPLSAGDHTIHIIGMDQHHAIDISIGPRNN
jgi:hypothetical protein